MVSRRQSMLRGLWIVGTVLLLSVLAVACGAEEPAEPDPTATPPAAPTPSLGGVLPAQPAPTTAPAPTAAPAAAPAAPRATPTQAAVAMPEPSDDRYGGTLKWVPSSSFVTTDPTSSWALVNGLSFMLYDTLLAWDKGGALHPQALDSWAVEDGGKRFVLTLRDDQSFHDGRPVTVEDVLASFDRWRSADPYGPFINPTLTRAGKVDDKSMVFEFSEPNGVFIPALGKGDGPVPVIHPLDEAMIPSSESVITNVGSGPYKLTEWSVTHKLVMEKFENYVPREEQGDSTSGAKIAYLDVLEAIEIPDQEVRVAALTNGEVDFLHSIDTDFYTGLLQVPDVQLYFAKPGGQPNFWFQKLYPPFDNTPEGRKLRQAVAAVIDAEEMMTAIAGPPDLWTLCDSFWACGTPFGRSVAPEYYNQNDIEKAKRLMDEAGYDGEEVILLDFVQFRIGHVIATLLKPRLEAAGFNVTMKPLDPAAGSATVLAERDVQLQNRDWHIATTWLSTWHFSPIANALLVYDGGWGAWRSDEFRALQGELAQAASFDEQIRIYDEMQVVAFQDPPYIPLGMFFFMHPMSRDLENYQHTIVNGPYFPGMYWKDASRR